MSTRKQVSKISKDWNSTLHDRNGKPLQVGDVVAFKPDIRKARFDKMGIVEGSRLNNHGEFFLVVRPLNKTKIISKFNHNVRKSTIKKATLWMLENA